MDYTGMVYRRRQERGLHAGYYYSSRLTFAWRRITVNDWIADRRAEWACACNLTITERKRYSS